LDTSISEMKDDIDTQPKSQLYIKKINRGRTLLANFLVTLVAKFGLHSWLIPMRIWLQKLIVYLSKACWSLSEFVLRMIRPFIMNSEKISLFSDSNWSGVRRQPLAVHLIYSVLDAFSYHLLARRPLLEGNNSAPMCTSSPFFRDDTRSRAPSFPRSYA
jgi:hypothetical protein